MARPRSERGSVKRKQAAKATVEKSKPASGAARDRNAPLNDIDLVNCAYSHLKELDFPDEAHKDIERHFKDIQGSPLFQNPGSFSLFLYNADVLKGHPGALADLWKCALQGAIWVIKEHDLRERPFRYSDRNKASEITRPDIMDIAKYYHEASDFERILYGADQWYRDHFAHVLRVWLLGLYVIFGKRGEGKLIAPQVAKKPDNEDHKAKHSSGAEEIGDINWKLYEPAEYYAAFTIAALTHDLGYPIQKVAKLNASLDRILQSTGGMEWQLTQVTFSLARHEAAQQLLKFIAAKPQFIELENGRRLKYEELETRILDRLKEYVHVRTGSELEALHYSNAHGAPWGAEFRTQWKYHQKYSDSLEKLHHGLLSAILLQRKLLFFKEGEFALEEDYQFSLEEVRQFMIRREILRAIATHTCPDIYIINLLSIESLLFFCDEIQEWGRPFFSDLYGGRREPKSTVRLPKFDDKNVEWEVEVEELDLSSAAHWLLNSGRNLFRRLRSAPNTYNREIAVKFTLKWKTERIVFVACCEFDPPAKAGEPFKFQVFLEQHPRIKEELSALIEKTNQGKNEKAVESSIENVLKGLLRPATK
jgi:hypothetical protein